MTRILGEPQVVVSRPQERVTGVRAPVVEVGDRLGGIGVLEVRLAHEYRVDRRARGD